jgi:CHC2-type zinc finger protein
MSPRHLNSTDNAELRAKIDEAKRRLPLPQLMEQEGLGDRTKKRAHCPFHDDKHESFSVYQGADGFWHYKCFTGCGEGDEIMFLRKLRGLSASEAMNLYLSVAGFPSRAPRKSPECPQSPQSPQSLETRKSHGFPKSPMYPVYPMSNGQELEGALKAYAARNACKERGSEKKALWQLTRDLVAVQKCSGRKLSNSDWVLALREWHQLSLPVLDPRKTFDDYLAAFLAKPTKVRVPTGDGDTLNKALEAISNLSPSELPVIPGIPDAPENLRKVAALHRELSRLCGGKKYFLTCRDAAKVCPHLSHQKAYNINLALAQLGVIEIIRAGDPHPGGRASYYCYLLPQSANPQTAIAA